MKYRATLSTNVYTELDTKITTATTLTTAAETQAESDARATLDQAANVTGEVEAKLSTLGQVEIDPETGIIVDIDFSIDPMQIDRDDKEARPQIVPSDQGSTNSGTGVTSETSLETNIQTEVIDIPVEVNTQASSGVGAGL